MKEKNATSIAITVSNSLSGGMSSLKAIESIKKAGFDNVTIKWFNNKYWKHSQEAQLNFIQEVGLNVIFAHLGYKNMNAIWEKDIGIAEDIDMPIVESYKKDIKNCKDNNIPVVVMHLTNGLQTPDLTETGLVRIQKIADYAQELDVKIAFENTGQTDFLGHVISNIKNENVGVCFDSGRHHIHNQDDSGFELYNNRIFAVHLHDNDRENDLHLLPFDGTINWDHLVNKLKESKYKGPLALDPSYCSYLKLSPLKFYKKGYRIGEKLVKMFGKESL